MVGFKTRGREGEGGDGEMRKGKGRIGGYEGPVSLKGMEGKGKRGGSCDGIVGFKRRGRESEWGDGEMREGKE